MRSVAIILGLLIAECGYAHQGHQAFYRLHVENTVLTLTCKLELPDLDEVLTANNACSDDQEKSLCSALWLAENISIAINGSAQSLILESSYLEEGHLILNYSLSATVENVDLIEITNRAFIDHFPDYQNIVQIAITETEGYNLNQSRTSFSHRLKPTPWSTYLPFSYRCKAF